MKLADVSHLVVCASLLVAVYTGNILGILAASALLIGFAVNRVARAIEGQP